MPKPNKQIIIDAIAKDIGKGMATEKICAAICSKFQFTERTFYNHLPIAQKQHTEAQELIKSKIAIIDEQAAIDARKKAIMSSDERKEWLTKVVNGEIEVPLRKPFWNPKLQIMQFILVLNMADIGERLKASAELSKMEGDYAPTKIAATDTKGNDVEQTLIVWGGKQILI